MRILLVLLLIGCGSSHDGNRINNNPPMPEGVVVKMPKSEGQRTIELMDALVEKYLVSLEEERLFLDSPLISEEVKFLECEEVYLSCDDNVDLSEAWSGEYGSRYYTVSRFNRGSMGWDFYYSFNFIFRDGNWLLSAVYKEEK